MEEFAPGTIVHGHYRVIRKLGQGAHGSVHEVDHAVFGRMALKIRGGPSGDDFAVILREAQTLGAISHAHIVRVYEAGVLTVDGESRAFLSTELLPHGSLEDLLDREMRLSGDHALLAAAQLLHALEEIHRRTPAIVHRDIIPSNIFIASRTPFIVKLGDFAIAKPLIDGVGMVPTDGEYRYFPPESRRGYMNLQTDLYAVGLVLYQMVTGSFPFPNAAVDPSKDLETYLRPRDQPPRPPSTLRRSLGPGVDGLVLRALAPRPQDRFPDAAAFRQACLAVLEMEG